MKSHTFVDESMYTIYKTCERGFAKDTGLNKKVTRLCQAFFVEGVQLRRSGHRLVSMDISIFCWLHRQNIETWIAKWHWILLFLHGLLVIQPFTYIYIPPWRMKQWIKMDSNIPMKENGFVHLMIHIPINIHSSKDPLLFVSSFARKSTIS